MADPESQRAYLEEIQKEINTAIKDKRDKQLTLLQMLSAETRNKLLEDDLAVLSAVRATNNSYLYEEIDIDSGCCQQNSRWRHYYDRRFFGCRLSE